MQYYIQITTLTPCIKHFENQLNSVAIKSDNVIFYAYQINKRDSWFKFKKNEKNWQDGATIQKHKK